MFDNNLKFQKVLLKLGLTNEDLEKVTQIDVPDEFNEDTQFYKKFMLDHLEQKRQRLLQEVQYYYDNYNETPNLKAQNQNKEQHLERLHSLHKKEIDRIYQQQQLMKEKEEKRKQKDKKIELFSKNKEKILKQRQSHIKELDMIRQQKLQEIESIKLQNQKQLKLKIEMNEKKAQNRQNQLQNEREIRLLNREQQLSERVHHVQQTRYLQQLELAERLQSRRESYDTRMKQIESIKSSFQVRGRNHLGYKRSRTNSDQPQSLDQSVQRVIEQQQKQVQDMKIKYIKKQIKLDDAIFKQKRIERINDQKKQKIFSKIMQYNNKCDQIRSYQDFMKQQRLKLHRQYEKEKQRILSEYQQNRDPSLQQLYLTPQKQFRIPKLKRSLKKPTENIFLLNSYHKKMSDIQDEKYCKQLLELINNTNIHDLEDELIKFNSKKKEERKEQFKQHNYLQLFT